MAYCKKCGKEIVEESAKFCPTCGNSLIGEQPSSSSDNSSEEGLSLRIPLFIISALSLIGAFFVYQYGHNAFSNDSYVTSSPLWVFWEHGNGPSIFAALIIISVVTFIFGCFVKKSK